MKILLGVIASAILVGSFIPYFFNIFRGRTKPHAFSWLVWTVLTGIAFAAQVLSGGGPGAWVMGVTSLCCLAVFVLGLVKGERSFPLFDWLCLASAACALALWWATDDPTGAVILVTITDVLAFMPTYRKGWIKPFEDTASTFALNALAYLLGFLALETFTVATWLYPAALILTDGGFAALLVYRRIA